MEVGVGCLDDWGKLALGIWVVGIPWIIGSHQNAGGWGLRGAVRKHNGRINPDYHTTTPPYLLIEALLRPELTTFGCSFLLTTVILASVFGAYWYRRAKDKKR